MVVQTNEKQERKNTHDRKFAGSTNQNIAITTQPTISIVENIGPRKLLTPFSVDSRTNCTEQRKNEFFATSEVYTMRSADHDTHSGRSNDGSGDPLAFSRCHRC
jgi:hypothetical protein